MRRYSILAFVMFGLVAGGCPGTVPNTNDNSSDNSNSNGNTNDNGDSDLRLSGKISNGAAARKRGLTHATAGGGETVVACSTETGALFYGETDTDGSFAVELPEDERGHAFIVTVLDAGGRAAGPLVFDTRSASGFTAIEVSKETSLGTIEMPSDLSDAPLAPGEDADPELEIATNISARVDTHGVPVGVMSIGKGADAEGAANNSGGQAADSDRDGLVDAFDADNDGDGIVDEIDGAAPGGVPGASDVTLNFFMNLKVGSDRAGTYYSQNGPDIDAALEQDVILTFEVLSSGPSAREISSVRMLTSPAPTYLATADQMLDSGGGLTFVPWADRDFEFENAGDRFRAFVRPNALITAGDTFTIEVTFTNGDVERFARMINFVFKNIPRLVEVGTAADHPEFDGGQPITFDGTQDLVLVFNPPPDETGAFLTGLDYQFEIFYQQSGGAQINDIDIAATWPTLPAGMDSHRTVIVVSKDDLTLSAQDTFTFTLPKEAFVDIVETAGGPVVVEGFQIDIAAQSSGGNAAIKLQYEKQ